MATKIEKDKMRAFLRLMPDHIKKNVVVAEPSYPHALHISSNTNIPKFTPMVSKRGLTDEDRSVPRISVCSTLWDCLIGYASIIKDFTQNGADDWCGGYVIYGLPHRLKLIPNQELLPDVTQNSEEWLVGFDSAHKSIEPVKLGKVFVHSVGMTAATESKKLYDITLYVEVSNNIEAPLPLMPDHSVTTGHWKIQVSGVSSHVNWDETKAVIHAITKDEFIAKKKIAAGMLSHAELPPSGSWTI